jgi:hypothetical protein
MLLLFISLSAAAKPTSHLTYSVVKTNDLVERLAEDEDFKTYSITTYQFLAKIKETKSGKLLAKYLKQIATPEEKESLTSALSFHSEIELQTFLINTLRQKAALDHKFTELQDFTKHKSDIRIARSRAAASVMKPMVTVEECWDMFFGLSTVWLNLCLLEPNWNECWIAASAQIGTMTVTCLLIAD